MSEMITAKLVCGDFDDNTVTFLLPADFWKDKILVPGEAEIDVSGITKPRRSPADEPAETEEKEE